VTLGTLEEKWVCVSVRERLRIYVCVCLEEEARLLRNLPKELLSGSSLEGGVLSKKVTSGFLPPQPAQSTSAYCPHQAPRALCAALLPSSRKRSSRVAVPRCPGLELRSGQKLSTSTGFSKMSLWNRRCRNHT
jgi:hypothetical protein